MFTGPLQFTCSNTGFILLSSHLQKIFQVFHSLKIFVSTFCTHFSFLSYLFILVLATLRTSKRKQFMTGAPRVLALEPTEPNCTSFRYYVNGTLLKQNFHGLRLQRPNSTISVTHVTELLPHTQGELVYLLVVFVSIRSWFSYKWNTQQGRSVGWEPQFHCCIRKLKQ
jgi:hypothetical protein